MMEILSTTSEAIFFWSKFLIPIVFIVTVLKLNFRYLKFAVIIEGVNIALLFACMLISTNFIVDIFVGRNNLQSTILGRLTGPYWFAGWILIFPPCLLPQLIWFKRFRKSPAITYTWFFVALAISLFVRIAEAMPLSQGDDYSGGGWHRVFFFNIFPLNITLSLIIFIVAYGAIYAVLLWRNTGVNNAKASGHN